MIASYLKERITDLLFIQSLGSVTWMCHILRSVSDMIASYLKERITDLLFIQSLGSVAWMCHILRCISHVAEAHSRCPKSATSKASTD
jgi:hypothetical protein